MGIRSRKAVWLYSSLLTSALALPAPLLAQTGRPSAAVAGAPQQAGPPNTAAANGPDPVADDSQNGDIVVTAQKRTQNLQDVPISISVLDGRKLEQLQVRDFRDYVKYLPSVATTGGNPGNNPTVVVRGIATDGGGYVQGTLPTVGIYLDEQPITSINGAADLHVYDIARVEVLNGPQGTLFGASSEAGTIRLITNRPDFTKLAGGFDLELNNYTGHAYGGKAEGFLNVPFSDNIALRVVGYYDKAGGYITNLPSSRTYPSSGITVNNDRYAGRNNNPVETYGGRAQLAIKLDDDWTITPAILGQVQNRDGNFRSFPARGRGELVTQRYGSDYNRDKFYQASLTITGKIADLDLTYAGSYFDRHAKGDNDYADYAYFYDTLYGSGENFVDNSGNLIDPTQTFTATGRIKKMSQEARLATPTDWRVHGIVGIFYQRQKEFFRYDYTIPNLADALSVSTSPGSYYLDVGERIDRDFAVFTQADFDLTDKLTLTGGVRYYTYNNTLIDFNGTRGKEGSSTCYRPATIRGAPCISLGTLSPDGKVGPVQAKDHGFTYRGNVTYKFDRDHLVYATVSSGFRPGGSNTRSTADPNASISYGSEKLTNYEIGTKNTFFNNRLTANLTLFWEELRDIQLEVEAIDPQTGTPGLFTTQNVGAARSRGGELDITLRPIDGLTISNASTYTDATLREDYLDGDTLVAPKGERLPFTSPFKTNLIARYEFPFGANKAHVQASEVYQTAPWNDFSAARRAFFGKRDAYAVTDLSAGLEFGSSTLEFYANNLFDRRAITGKFYGCGISICKPDVYVVYNQPRLIGVRFGQRF